MCLISAWSLTTSRPFEIINASITILVIAIPTATLLLPCTSSMSSLTYLISSWPIPLFLGFTKLMIWVQFSRSTDSTEFLRDDQLVVPFLHLRLIDLGEWFFESTARLACLGRRQSFLGKLYWHIGFIGRGSRFQYFHDGLSGNSHWPFLRTTNHHAYVSAHW